MTAVENKTEGMNREQILETIVSLSHSQGFYQRLLEHLLFLRENKREAFNDAMENLEEQNFKDAVDLVLYLES